MHERVALVHDLGSEPGQAVDHLVDGVLVPRDQRAGEDDGVALLDVHEVVVALRDPAERRHRLALAAGRDQDLTLRREVGEVLGVDHDVGRDVEVAEVLGDAHVAHHRAPDVPDLATVPDRRVEHLLHPVHMGGEAGDDDPLVAAREHAVEHRRDVLLGGGETGDLGVGGVGEEEVDPLLPQPGERAEVGDPAVERKLVHLEVARVQHQGRAGADRDGQGVGDRVVDGDELELVGAEREPVARLHLVVDGLPQPVLAELGVQQGERQLGAHQRDVATLAQEVRRSADVVLMAVGEDQRLHLVEPVSDRVEVGQDQVDARVGLLGEEHATVDDQQATVVLEDGHVATDLAQSAERIDP
jgi:hypothetical protein